VQWPQKQAIAETKAIFGPLRERIHAAVETLEGRLVCSTILRSLHCIANLSRSLQVDAGADADEGELKAAEEAMAKAKSN